MTRTQCPELSTQGVGGVPALKAVRISVNLSLHRLRKWRGQAEWTFLPGSQPTHLYRRGRIDEFFGRGLWQVTRLGPRMRCS